MILKKISQKDGEIMKENVYLKLKDYCITLNDQFTEIKEKEDECFSILQQIAIEYAKEHPDFDAKFKAKLLERKEYYNGRIANDKGIERKIVEDKDMSMLHHKIRVDFTYVETFLPSLNKRIQMYSKIQSVEEVGEEKFIAYFAAITNLRYYSSATAGCYEKCLKTVEEVYVEDKRLFKKFFRNKKSEAIVEK